uniref:Uncharacterized protein n=1 Tax=Meloidogyne enterolobii TaxID=390850 RepID=A0A6V7V9T3_MELEN|nr:unnamed protein product [Meloidogyne enterolobii]
MKTPKQLEEWSFSTINSDNIKNKIGDKTLIIARNFTGKMSNLETSTSIDGLSTTCSSCCLSQNIIENLKQRMEKLEEIQKLNSEHESQIKNLEKNFQTLKTENDQKDEKINALEEEIKKANELIDKKLGDLTIKLSNAVFKYVNFVKTKNKWSEIDFRWKCCENNCINTNNPIGKCIRGFGFVNLINDKNIKYIKCLEGNRGSDNYAIVYAENLFKKPENCLNYSLYYFEIKCESEGKLNSGKMVIGLRNCSTNNRIRCFAKCAEIRDEKGESFELSSFTWNNNDIFGCGLVYPPTNMMNEFPYVFFTQNGKQIGKGILLKENFDSYKPYVDLLCCSVEANFGSDFETKPFKYDI